MLPTIPDIEDDIFLPPNALTAMPELSPHEELEMRVRTIKLISELTQHPVLPTTEDIQVAAPIARRMIEDSTFRPEFSKYPNEVMAYLASAVAQANCSLVDELSDLKLYVVNKLVFEVENARDSKSRITAIKALGEVDGVDAFKKRSEMTVTVKPLQEVEKELMSVLDRIEYKVIGNRVVQEVEENEVSEAEYDENSDNQAA